jgi:S-methylmethionine-dependent homocysteine/selenocysteine methylase
MIILDGGLGRQLAAMGAPFQQPQWSAATLIEAPHFVRAAHEAFIAAGVDVISTNSYAVVPHHIGEEMFAERADELLDVAAREAAAAVTAADRPIKIAASVPPMFGSYLPDRFDEIRGREMMKKFRQQLAPVADIFIAETLSVISEVTTYLDVFEDVSADLWVSVSLDDVNHDPDEPRLRSGEPLAALLSAIEPRRFDALLFNCSQPEVMSDAIILARSTLDGFARKQGKVEPLIGVYANAFPLFDESYQGSNASLVEIRADITPENYTRYAQKWAREGADIIGGCCGISPDHIAHLVKTLRA